jgi:hypothetical protein
MGRDELLLLVCAADHREHRRVEVTRQRWRRFAMILNYAIRKPQVDRSRCTPHDLELPHNGV